MTKEDAQRAFLPIKMIEHENANFERKEKLKISLPLIPLILKYEKELTSPNIVQQLKKDGQEGGWKRLLVKNE